MDLKYNLAQAWLLRDRSPLPITTLEVIKDSLEFVTLASSKHLERLVFDLFFPHVGHMKRAHYVQSYIMGLRYIYCEIQCFFSVMVYSGD